MKYGACELCPPNRVVNALTPTKSIQPPMTTKPLIRAAPNARFEAQKLAFGPVVFAVRSHRAQVGLTGEHLSRQEVCTVASARTHERSDTPSRMLKVPTPACDMTRAAIPGKIGHLCCAMT